MKNLIQEITSLLEVFDRLLGPNGCPWDKKQTLETLQPYLQEEAHELIEAIDEHDLEHIREELGDVIFLIFFIAKVAEKEKICLFSEAIHHVKEKMISRHPHIYGDIQVQSADEVYQNWEKIKQKEKKRPDVFEGIPPSLPTLLRAQKIVDRIYRHKKEPESVGGNEKITEEEIGRRIWELVELAYFQKIDVDGALRRWMKKEITGD